MSSPNEQLPSFAAASHSPRNKGVYSLFGALTLIVVIWGILLPAVGQLPAVRNRIDFLDSRGIDPSAKFYTDQEAGHRNAAIVRTKTTEHPEFFWTFN